MTQPPVAAPGCAAIAMEWSAGTSVPDRSPPDARDLSSLDDDRLVALAAAGRRDAFDLIVTRHRRAVYMVCYRFAHHHEDASDLAQDVFVRAWRALPRFKGESALSTWLYRIAVNVSLNKAALKVLPTEALAAGGEIEDLHSELPGEALARQERVRAVRAAIRALPPKQRATLILRVYHELPHQQIAQVLGNSVGTVKANFFHALRNLRKALGSMP